MHVEDIAKSGAALDDARRARFAQAFEDGEHVGQLGFRCDAGEEGADDGAVLDGLGRSLGSEGMAVSYVCLSGIGRRRRRRREKNALQVGQGSMACVSQQCELSRRMTPRLHLLAVLQPPLARLLNEPQKGPQLRVPLLEEIPHLLHVGFRRVDHVW